MKLPDYDVWGLATPDGNIYITSTNVRPDILGDWE